VSPKHWKGRPPPEAERVMRLAGNGRWYADNGEPGLAFSGTLPGDWPYAWGPDCDCLDERCPRRKASRYTCSRFSAANGRDMERTS
jgi:hypothetical protein